MNRYLTIEEKADEIMRWDSLRWQYRGAPAPRGGLGEPDPAIYPLCDALNLLEGVCTVQSCAGHDVAAADGSGTYRYPGQLWLRLSSRMWESAERDAEHLLAEPTVEQVSFLYRSGNAPVMDILFEGQERDRLPQSAAAIRNFFYRCSGLLR